MMKNKMLQKTPKSKGNEKAKKVRNKDRLLETKEVLEAINTMRDEERLMQTLFIQNIGDSFLGIKKAF